MKKLFVTLFALASSMYFELSEKIVDFELELPY